MTNYILNQIRKLHFWQINLTIWFINCHSLIRKRIKKCKVKFHQSSDTEKEVEENHMVMQFQLDNNNSEEEGYFISQYSYNLNKTVKTSHNMTNTIGEIKTNEKEKVPMRILFDTGTTSTIILQKFTTTIYTNMFKTKPTKWNTLASLFYMRKNALIKFKLSEFSTHKEIS